MRIFPALGASLILGVTPLLAQQVPTVPLGPSTARFAEPFTTVGGVREVAPGKVIVVDPRDRVAELIDLASGATTKVGHEGSGPGEFQFPSALFPLSNGGTLLVDPSQSRFLRIDPRGKVVETFSYPPGLGPQMRVRGTDAQGRVYFEGAALGVPSGRPDEGIVTPDSVPVIRWDRRNGKVDSLLLVKGVQLTVSATGEGSSRNFHVQQRPYDSRDGWAVGADGRVAVVRGTPYRVDIRAPSGSRATGTVVVFRALPITQGDKEAFLESQRVERRAMSVSGDGGGSGGGSGAASTGPRLPGPSADEYEWPATKPFFDAESVRMSPTGELWSERTRAAGDDIPVYDVFDATGKLVRRVTFPTKTRLVGFGAGTVYVVRTDDDDLQYLERYNDCGARCDSRGVPLER